MAIYRTTTAELTSIADAIRAKTGETSSLIYPTGFVSAIEGITAGSSAPYSYLGENAELIDTLYEHTFKLSDTNFNASSITTSNATILNYQSLGSIQLSADYDYIIKNSAYVLYEYTGTVTASRFLEMYYAGLMPFGRKPSVLNDFTNNTVSTVSTGISTGLYNGLRHNNTWTANSAGITFSTYGPTFSNNTSSTFGATPYTLTIRANSNSTYMAADAINAIDTDKTTIYMKIELYRCNQNDIWHGLNEETVKLYQAVHNLT